MREEDLMVMSDSTLMALCLEDGHTVVDSEGVIHVDVDNAHPPKLDVIKAYVRNQPTHEGRAPVVKKSDPALVQRLLEMAPSISSTQSEEADQSQMAEKLTALCQAAVNAKASDIHIEVVRQETRILLRVDGKRRQLDKLANGESARLQSDTLGKQLARYALQMKGNHNYTERTPLNDRFELTLTCDGQGEKVERIDKRVEWRVALMPLDRGIKVVLRCLTPLGAPLTFEAMDLLPTQKDLFMSFTKRRSGIGILTGPMGSGKSSLMFALFESIDREARCCHTLEDPVEFEQEGVTKTLVEPRRKFTEEGDIYLDYEFYAQEQLRQDIDITAFGELRTAKATKEFIRKGETGGLALSTLHANSAIGVPAILIEQLGIAPSMVAAPGLMQLFSHQKLIRKLCPDCALPLSEAGEVYQGCGKTEEFDVLTRQMNAVIDKHHQSQVRVRHPSGCQSCDQKGEKGRLLVLEMIALEDADREFIKQQDYLGWKRYLESQGWPDIREHTLHRIRLGQVDLASASEQVDGLMPVASQQRYAQLKQEMGSC